MKRITLSTTRKLKVDKNFQPLPEDEGDEFYPNGIFEFNITKLLAFINDHPTVFQPEEILVKIARTFPSSTLKESVIRVADITQPIVLAEIAPGKFNVIDGHHRLEKAYRDGENVMGAYRVRAEQHIAFLTSVMAYQDYIRYWNEKLRFG